MRFAILSMVALMTIVSAAPAQAQLFHHRSSNYNNGTNINATQAQLQARINEGLTDGRLSKREASSLQSKMKLLNRLEARMRNSGSGLSFKERNRLVNQLNKLNEDVTRNLNDFEHRRLGYRNHRGWH